MNREGHAALSLLIFSLVMIPLGWSMEALMFIMFGTGSSSLPDLDQSWHIEHRAYTHNIGFGLLFGTIFGFVFGATQSIYFGILIFLAVLGGVLSHLLGDMIAGLNYDGSPWEIEPLQPFSDKSISYGI